MLSILIVTTRIFNTIRKTLKLFSNYTVYTTWYTFFTCTEGPSKVVHVYMLHVLERYTIGINYYLLYLNCMNYDTF